VVGVDLDEGSLGVARELANKQGVSNVRVQTGSVYVLPFSDASFDVIVSNQVVNHLNGPIKALEEIGRVLKLGE
jgi:ubiquinone/menaquinone biosynthesis C-methylase UbiE